MATFSKEERQKGGKVYTPQEIVTWIHDKLEEQSPLSLRKTYWDPACGTGHFPLDWYDRLKKHWEDNRDQYPEIKNEHEAHKWIIEKCIYFSDIDPFAIRLCKLGLFLKDPSVLCQFNAHLGDSLLDEPFGNKNAHLGDSLLDEPFGNKKFDCVAGNPPYGGARTKVAPKERFALYKKLMPYKCRDYNIYWSFILLGLNRANNVGFVTPTTWLTQLSTLPLRQEISKTHHLCSVRTDLQSTKIFGSDTTQATASFTLSVNRPEKIILERGLFKASHNHTELKYSDLRYEEIIVPTSKEAYRLYWKLMQSPQTIGDFFKIKQGNVNTVEYNLKKLRTKPLTTPLYGGRENKRFSSSSPREYLCSGVGLSEVVAINNNTSSEAHRMCANWSRGSLLRGAAVAHTLMYAVPKDSGELKILLGLVNSSLFSWLIGMRSDNNTIGAARYSSLPYPIQLDSVLIRKLVERLIKDSSDVASQEALDNAIFDGFNLTEAERDLVKRDIAQKK